MERLVRVAIAFCVFYAALPVLAHRSEVFPVFSWSLFSSTPDPIREDFGVRLLELDGRELSPPVYLEQSGLVSGGAAAQAREAVQRLSRALRQNDDQLPALVAFFESTYFDQYSTGRYQVVLRRYDILERGSCDCYLSEEVLAEIDFDRPADGKPLIDEDAP
jgi:hypothetical protein